MANNSACPGAFRSRAYNLTDAQSNYQYRAFGVPGLGFKRGLAEDIVIAPYATSHGADGRAAGGLSRIWSACGRKARKAVTDFTKPWITRRSRLPRGQTHALVQSFMAHHQGMTLLALAHRLLDRPMQRRFQANPFFKTAELLLQERVPRENIDSSIRTNWKPNAPAQSSEAAGSAVPRFHKSEHRPRRKSICSPTAVITSW